MDGRIEILMGFGPLACGIVLLIFRFKIVNAMNRVLAPSVQSDGLDRGVSFGLGLIGALLGLVGLLIVVGGVGKLVE